MCLQVESVVFGSVHSTRIDIRRRRQEFVSPFVIRKSFDRVGVVRKFRFAPQQRFLPVLDALGLCELEE